MSMTHKELMDKIQAVQKEALTNGFSAEASMLSGIMGASYAGPAHAKDLCFHIADHIQKKLLPILVTHKKQREN